MKAVSLPPFEVTVQAVEGVGVDGVDEVSLEFKVVGGAGPSLWFAIFKPEGASTSEACLTVDPQSGPIPLPVVAWAVSYAESHL
ncbi:hypothetical protein BKA21_001694 [Cellulomonas oligotrophica]|uniref:Uncharacterized protein n=1 Tax=Cellulomonas oligotrophica TaxID=931536 RepID=A0A7Y9FF91_9CELL|nr:hypothetical protein [Cellulomonas oligotrophica]GIG30847.1 hypothetical protein Col01nite_00060 [Cellulomonas oligotrophica]